MMNPSSSIRAAQLTTALTVGFLAALLPAWSGCSSKVYSADCDGMVEHSLDCGGAPPGDLCHFQSLMIRFGCGDAFFATAKCLAAADCGDTRCPELTSDTLEGCIADACADPANTDPVCACNNDPSDKSCICAKDPHDPEC